MFYPLDKSYFTIKYTLIFKLFIKNVVFFRQSINKIQINALYYIFRLIKIVSYFTFSLSTFGISQTFV